MTKKQLLNAAKFVSAKHNIRIVLCSQRTLALASHKLVWKTKRSIATHGRIVPYSGWAAAGSEFTAADVGRVEKQEVGDWRIATGYDGTQLLILLSACRTKCVCYELPADGDDLQEK